MYVIYASTCLYGCVFDASEEAAAADDEDDDDDEEWHWWVQ